jgi:GNAT superfamily N-acetyltransferase
VYQAQAASNIFNPFPSIAQAGVEGRRPTGAEVGMDAGFLAAGFLPVGKALQGLKFINRGSRNVAEPGVNYVEAVLPEAQRVNPEDAVGSMRILPDGTVGQIFVEPAYRRQGIATEMWNYANRQGLNPAHSPAVDQTAAGKAWVASLGNPNMARPALETGEAITARRDAINRLLNEEGPQAINQFLNNPLTAYLPTINPGLLSKFFAETSERIPKGTQMFRAPSKGEVESRLPREIGAEYTPGTIRSAGGPSDLQRLGEVLGGKTVGDLTGGNQSYAPGLASITAKEDLPGILDINEFLARYAGQYGGQGRPAIAPTSKFNVESVLGPQIRYRVNDFRPGVGEVPPTWYLDAYNR